MENSNLSAAQLPPGTPPSRIALPRRQRLGWRKRIAFSFILLTGFAVFVEVLCFFALTFISGDAARGIRYIRDQQNEINAESDLIPLEVTHPYVGWTRNPDANRPEMFEGRAYRPNEFGLMDTGSPIRKRAPEKVIVAVMGGSVGWQMTVSGENTFLRELQKQSRFQGKTIELVRLAVSGYKQPQQLMLLTYLLSLGAEFDVLVNIDGYNEVALHRGENAESGVFAAYPRAWKARHLGAANPNQIRATADLITTQERRRSWGRFCSYLPFQNSSSVNFLWLVVHKSYFMREVRLTDIVIRARLDQPGYQILGPPQTFRNSEEMFATLVEYWAQSSRQLNRLCRVNGIEYHHVLPPNQHLAGSKPIVDANEVRVALLQTDASRAASIGYPLLVLRGKALHDEGLNFHNLTQLFSEVIEPIYIDDCCHYNASGNTQLATAVARIIGQHLVQPSE